MSNEVAETKQQIIGELYSIRAGVSYISELSDRCDATWRVHDVLKKGKAKIERKNADLRDEVRKQEGMEASMNAELNNRKQACQEHRHKIKEFRSSSFISFAEKPGLLITWLCLFLTALAGLIAMIVLCCTGDRGEEYIFVHVIIGIICAIAACVFGYFCVVYDFFDAILEKYRIIKEEKKDYKNALVAVVEQENKIEKEKKLIPGRIEAAKQQINSNEDKIAAIAQSMPKVEQECESIKNEAEAVYRALVKTYGSFFHPDNWQNLDRVVYYLSTGRAESLRDALNLMDQRLNAEMIANEIKASSNMIAKEIQMSTEQTVYALGRCADELSTAIHSVGNSINRTILDLGESINANTRMGAAQVAATNRLVSAQELNNSLQRQSNKTMEQMLNDYQVVNNRVHYA